MSRPGGGGGGGGGMEEWRHCVDWLIRVGVMAPNHRSTQKDAAAFDFAQHLRDGVILCHLATKLAPGSIETRDVSQRPQMSQFLCLQNIRVFLRALDKVFKVPKDALFEPDQLFHLKDFGRVIACLSRLSKTPIARDTTFAFPPDSFDASASADEEDIYMPLEHLANENEIDDEDIEDVYECVTEMAEEEEEIYDSICKHKSLPSEPELGVVPVTKRDHCLKELLETEKNYVDALEMTVKNFVQPLKPLINKEDKEKIFINIEDLKRFHAEFYAELKKLYPRDVSDVFLKYKASFLSYGKYCSLLTDSQEHIETVKRRSEPARLKFEECEKNAKDGRFRLRDILSVPMQRILKYPLLLRELAKNSSDQDDHVKAKLDACLEAMQDVALFINEVKRDNETMQTIRQIQKSIIDINMPKNTSLTDYGKLQRDGQVSIKAHDDRISRQRHIFLFDKVLLICKAKGEDFRYKDALDLSKYRVEDRERGGSGATVVDKWTHQFVLSETSNDHAYTLYAKTKEAKRKWIEFIKLALDNNSPPDARTATHEFSLHTFPEPTYCGVCQKLLHGIFFQGYRCNRTETNVHKGCISKACEKWKSDGGGCRGGSREPRSLRGTPGDPLPPRPRPHNIGGSVSVPNGEPNGHPSHTNINIRDPASFERPTSNPAPIPPTTPGGYIHVGPFPPSVAPRGVPSPVDSPVTRRSPTRRNPSAFSSRKTKSENLSSYPWFVPKMSRSEAEPALRKSADGTFMIRRNEGNFALSVAFGGSVKHIRVKKEDHGFFIADVKFFESIPELVEWYASCSLVASFPGLDTCLRHPYNNNNNNNADGGNNNAEITLANLTINNNNNNNNNSSNNNNDCDVDVEGKDIGATAAAAADPREKRPSNATNLPILSYAVAIYDFSPSAVNQITLKEGDRVAIVSKAGGDRGWWKGQIVDKGSKKIGYFPMNYVKEEEES